MSNGSLSTEVTRLLAFFLATASCSPVRGPGSATDWQQYSGAPPFKEDCVSFETLVFANKTSSSLSGYTLVETHFGFEELKGVQVAARSVSSGEVRYAVSGSDGSYSLGELPEGEYEVWTCRDGFDELQFRLTIDKNSGNKGIELHLRASEAGAGSVAVVPIERDR